MSWFFNLLGKTSGNVAEVNASSEVLVALSPNVTTAGFAKILDANGDPINTTEAGYVNVSQDELIFVEQVDGAALNTNRWATSTSGMTIAQTNGFIQLNSGAATTSGNYAVLTSIRSIPLFSYLPLKVTFNGYTSANPQANAIMEVGVGMVAGTSAPTDGAFFRWNAAGEFRAIMNTGGVETPSSALALPPINVTTLFEIVIVEDLVNFLVDDVLIATIQVPAAFAFPTNSGRLPLFARSYTTGVAASAPEIFIGQVVVVQQGLSQEKPWDETLSSLGQSACQSPLTPFGQTANHANSTSPTSATLSNTAAGYATLGGRFQFAAPAGAATDYALFAFQVPAGYQFYVKRLAISTMNTGAIGGLTGTILDWSVGVNANAVSLATADGAGTWAPRRIPVGLQSFAISAAIGTMANDLSRNFETPLVVDGGRYLHIIVQIPVGLATVSQIIRGDVMINGYFE